MSNELINALENKVSTAVDAIEDLRTENKGLKEEKMFLESKLRELLRKIDGIGISPSSPNDSESQQDANTGYDSERDHPGFGPSNSEY